MKRQGEQLVPLEKDFTPPQSDGERYTTRHEPGVGRLEIWPLDPSEAILRDLLTQLFQHHWHEITFGPLIQGAAWEITAQRPPHKITFLDGYLTVDFGDLHFHLCIGEHRGELDAPTDPALARHRRTSRAEFMRRINRDGTPDLWAIRLFNGKDEQQISILLPNPFLSKDLKFLAQPAWSRLALWDKLRRQYLGIEPAKRDRSGKRMIYP